MMARETKGVALPSYARVEALEERWLLASTPWGAAEVMIGLDKLARDYPWLDGTGRRIIVVDQGMDVLHPLLGGDPATGRVDPRIQPGFGNAGKVVNRYWGDEKVDPLAAHGTGVAGILIGVPTVQGGKHYQGMAPGALIRVNQLPVHNPNPLLWEVYTTSEGGISMAVGDNQNEGPTDVQPPDDAINLTDFWSDFAGREAQLHYDDYFQQVTLLRNQHITFVAAPVANNWGRTDPKTGQPIRPAIARPASYDGVFAIGGVLLNGQIDPTSARGKKIALLAPSQDIEAPDYLPSTGQRTWGVHDGNSRGTPYVTGTAVLIKQIDPTITPDEIMKIMQDSGVTVNDTAADAAYTGVASYKRLDAYAAIKLAYQRRDDASDQGAGNDDMAHATVIARDSTGKGSLGGLKLLIHDHDYYTFTATKRGAFTVSAPQGAQILDGGGAVIGTVGSAGKLTQTLAAGKYYVHLFDPAKTWTVDRAGAQSPAGLVQYSVTVSGPPAGAPPAAFAHGTFNAMAYDSSNNLHFAWYDASSKTLKYAKRSAAGTWGATQTVDGGTDVGNFVSMALDATGKPGVAYYDANNADLKYAHFNGSGWDVQTVDSQFTTGYYPSLRYDAADHPVIAYYYKSGGDLKFAARGTSGWELSTIDSSEADVGRYPSLALNPSTGRWAVAYETTSGGAFKYAQQTKTGWSTAVIDDNGAGGGFVSLAFDGNGRPAFSYYDAANADLKFARQAASGTWSKTAIASKNSQGLYSNLFFQAAVPTIYFFNKTGNSLNAARGDGGAGWAFEALAMGGGRENRVAVSAAGQETFSWYDDASGGLKVVDL
jgi:hypothetical protein